MKRKYSTSAKIQTSPKRSRQRATISTDDQKPIDSELLYPYGNFQIDQWPAQSRLSCFRKEWFENRSILDIGCNVGFMTLSIALVFRPAKIVGLDIDQRLIDVAKKNLSICQQMSQEQKLRQRKQSIVSKSPVESKVFPVSMIRMYGPSTAPSLNPDEASTSALGFCRSVIFKCENFVLENDDDVKKMESEYDTITALNVTKWVHLNFGDDGLRRFFKRVYVQLRPGGIFILDAQPWAMYKRDMKKLLVRFPSFLLAKTPNFARFRRTMPRKYN